MEKRLVSTEKIAGYLDLTVEEINELVGKGQIPFVVLGDFIKFDILQIDAWIEKNSVKVGKKPIEIEEQEPEQKEKSADREKLANERELKECSNCFKKKPLDEFYKNVRNKDGRCSHCKICAKAGSARRWKEKKKVKKGQQTCIICKRDKPFEEFDINLRRKNGIGSYCKACIRTKSAERYKNNKQAGKEAPKQKEEKDGVPWEIGGKCTIENAEGKVIFENGKATCPEGEEWLRKKKMRENNRGIK